MTHAQTSFKKLIARLFFSNWPKVTLKMWLLIFMLAFAKGDLGVSSIKFGELSTVFIKEDQLFHVSLEALTSNSGKNISMVNIRDFADIKLHLLLLEYPSLISIYSKLVDNGAKTR